MVILLTFGDEYIPEAVLGIVLVSLTFSILPVFERRNLTNPLQSNVFGPCDP